MRTFKSALFTGMSGEKGARALALAITGDGTGVFRFPSMFETVTKRRDNRVCQLSYTFAKIS